MIEIVFSLDDKKVKSRNIQFLIDIESYVDLASRIVANNPFQRTRVSKGGSIYNLLKQDILDGCIIPPIVLASTLDITNDEANDNEKLKRILNDHVSLKILDGLQRTFSLIDVYNANKEHFDKLASPYQIRVEVYLSISDTGILYRMLTLNTGQTPMTLRHQLEILYSKYLNNVIDGVRVLKDVDADVVASINDFKFSDLIEGYNSFLEKNELPIDRFDILQTVKTIEFISSDESEGLDFKHFVKSYKDVVDSFDKEFPGWVYPKDEDILDEFRTKANPFGVCLYKVFNRSQPLTGFGAAVGELIDQRALKGLRELQLLCEELQFKDDDLILLNKFLDDVREKSKKIGNGQRIFFKMFFKNLFDKDGLTFLDIEASLNKAKNRAMAEV